MFTLFTPGISCRYYFQTQGVVSTAEIDREVIRLGSPIGSPEGEERWKFSTAQTVLQFGSVLYQ